MFYVGVCLGSRLDAKVKKIMFYWYKGISVKTIKVPTVMMEPLLTFTFLGSQ